MGCSFSYLAPSLWSHPGALRFTVDVDVPFLDRDQPRLYDPPRAAQVHSSTRADANAQGAPSSALIAMRAGSLRAFQFAYELALRVANNRRKVSTTPSNAAAVEDGARAPPPPVFVLFGTVRAAAEATEAWGPAARRRGIVAVAVAQDDGRGYRGKVCAWER